MLVKKIYNKLFSKNKFLSNAELYLEWANQRKPLPPPHYVKQYVIETINIEKKYNLLIETGTYYGQMIDAQLANFNRIISIELSKNLHSIAAEKYKKQKKVSLFLGDSGKVLRTVLKDINEPAIFWLDGHYSAGVTAKGSKECPIIEELEAIFDAKNFAHILLIDDARLFLGKNDYPTIEELEIFVKNKKPFSTIKVEDDIIQIHLN